MALPQWRKNQIAVTISSAFLNFGYTLVMSFLPIYVRELGVQSTGGIDDKIISVSILRRLPCVESNSGGIRTGVT